MVIFREMKRKTLKNIIFTGSVLVVFITLAQSFWVYNAYQLEKQKFKEKTITSLYQVIKIIKNEKYEDISTLDLVKETNDYTYRVHVHDKIQQHYLENILKKEFIAQNMNTAFEYRILNSFTDSVVHRKRIS